jgi:hypothetical protein
LNAWRGPLETPTHSDPIPDTRLGQSSGIWSLEGVDLSGSWTKVGTEHGVTYKWGDGNVDTYEEFVSPSRAAGLWS